MNLLVDFLPVTVVINGKRYKINSDFRACLKVILCYEDLELTNQEKAQVLLSNLYPVLPDDIQEAFKQASEFLDAGIVSGEGEGSAHRVYSFAKDASMIFAGFKQVHNIDIDTVDMHWWKFISLFMAVIASQDTAIGGLVSLRSRVKSGKASKEEKEAAREMGELFEVPEVDDRTLDERLQEAEFMKLINNGGK